MYHDMAIYRYTVYAVHLVVILIWWFGEYGLITKFFMSANTDNNQTIPFMSTLFAKLNARQFAKLKCLPNVPRTYTVLIVAYLFTECS